MRAMVVLGVMALVGGAAACNREQASPQATRAEVASSKPVASVPAGASTAPSASAPASASAGAGAAPGGWGFDGDKEGAPPSGFAFARTGSGAVGKWLVRAEPDAPSAPNVLAQLDADTTDYRFPVAVVATASFRDVDLSVRCKPVAGKVDQACGLVFRFRDENNYYVTRANALENNVNLYHVIAGKRQPFASWKGAVKSGVWHALRAVIESDHFTIYWDGAKVIEARDATFTDAGKVGLWTKADSVTYFDDLKASAP